MGEVQGEKEISLTGFLSCTTDSMKTGWRAWKTRDGDGMGTGQRMERKRQTTSAFHLTGKSDLKEIKDQSE